MICRILMLMFSFGALMTRVLVLANDTGFTKRLTITPIFYRPNDGDGP